RKKTVKGFARNAAQGKIAPCLPILRIKADKGQKVYNSLISHVFCDSQAGSVQLAADIGRAVCAVAVNLQCFSIIQPSGYRPSTNSCTA
ncbi:MAG: hypothetical protein ACLSHA_12245, partial [Neglectibacter timonensis]